MKGDTSGPEWNEGHDRTAPKNEVPPSRTYHSLQIGNDHLEDVHDYGKIKWSSFLEPREGDRRYQEQNGRAW